MGPTAYRFQAADGFSISLSANNGAYCSPRKNLWEPEIAYYNFTWPTDRHKNSPPVIETNGYSFGVDSGGYATIELGFPSGPVPQLSEYKEGNEPDEKSVYPFLPVSYFLDLMASHGGIISDHWPYIPPMELGATPELTLPHIVKALDPSVWNDEAWEAINWKLIPSYFLLPLTL